jgi:hypothetical protein
MSNMAMKPSTISNAEETGHLPPDQRRGKRPCYSDGLTSTKTYLIVASDTQFNGYNALGVRRLGPDQYKLHFWPHARAFKHSELFPQINLYRRESGGCSRVPYDGAQVDQDTLMSVLKKLKKVKSMETAPQEFILGVLQRGFNPREHASV